MRDGQRSAAQPTLAENVTSGRTATRTRSSRTRRVQLTAALGGEGEAGFDASDQMPPEVGSGSFWTGMVQYMQEGPDSLQGILDEIEASWPDRVTDRARFR